MGARRPALARTAWRALGGARGVRLLAVLLAGAAVLLAPPDLLAAATSPPPLAWWLLLPLFAVAEVLVVHLPTLRNAHSHSVREMPAVAGLAFLAPGEYVLAYVLACAAALALGRRQRGLKLAFNTAMFAVEAVLGVLTYHLVLGDAGAAEPRGWLAALCAVLVGDVVSAVAVTAAISLTEGRFDGEVLRESLGPGLVAAAVNTCLALMVVVLVLTAPVVLPLLAAALAMLVMGYRAHVALGAGYSRLQHLYRFVGSTEHAADVDGTAAAVLTDAAAVMRADGAALVVLPLGDEPGSRTTRDPDGTVRVEPYPGASLELGAWWAPALLGQPVLLSRGAPAPAPGARQGPRDGIAAPLRSDGRVHAVLMITDRSFERQTFDAQDLRLFTTLAAHAAVALDKSRLVDRLRRLAARREHEARHDPLTDLPNRRAFQELVASVTAAGAAGAVLMLDLDDFKDVNDTLGHDAGDLLLQEVGRRLCEGGGTVARLGGDEFAVLLAGAGQQDAVEHARLLLDALSRPLAVQGVGLLARGSIGIALVPQHGSTPEDVMRHADVAMYAAKRAGSGAEVYQPQDEQAVQRRLLLAADLPAALDRHEVEVWFQPQADARSGLVTGVEALLRWTHPLHGPVPPPEVVALAERTGLVRRLTDLVLQDALEHRAAWAAAGFDIDVSVNITARDLHDAHLPAVVASALTRSGTVPARLTLEITESGVMSDPDQCLAVLDRLAALGVRLSVDDFGTGHSSLAYLERLPVHEVKIDKSFVLRLERELADATVVRSTVTLAHDLGMHVVAEGIESAAAMARVAELGCETVQGYFLSRALAPAAALPWLRAHASRGLGADPVSATRR